jgi:hypothetical protein
MGNHDEYLAKGLENFVLSRRIADPLRHAMKSLGSEEMEWLRSLPYTAGVHEFTVTHASLAIAPEAFNFTKSAEEGNAENLLVINNAPELAARYTSNWKEHLGHSEPYQARN